MKLFELRRERLTALSVANNAMADAEKEGRQLNEFENGVYTNHMARVKELEAEIKTIEGKNTLAEFDPVAMLSGRLVRTGEPDPMEDASRGRVVHPKESALKREFSAWAKSRVGSLTGQNPQMEASAITGEVISIGSGSGLDSVAFATPTEIFPFLKSYFQNSPFEKAGSSIVSVAHMRPINVPVIAAGAEPAAYAEGQGPASGAAGSNPFGLSGFTMGANKRSRQTVATYESLQSTEVPMQPLIIDELLTALANAQTQDATTALFNALTAPPGVTLSGGALPPLQVGGSGVQADVYGQMTALRHSLVEGLEDPTNSFMLSRNTLAIIRNTRASTSGVVMFDPDKDTILGRPYYTNEYFDSICGAGFVSYGNWNRGAWLRRSPLITRVLDQLYWLNNEIGFIVTSWADNHFFAELVGAAQAPTNQPIYFTVLPSGSLP